MHYSAMKSLYEEPLKTEWAFKQDVNTGWSFYLMKKAQNTEWGFKQTISDGHMMCLSRHYEWKCRGVLT